MTHDPDFDGASLLVVGERILDAARERPALGLALGRERAVQGDPGQWFIGTRVAHAPDRADSDVRFDGGAPPLAALARRIEVGEFGKWFVDLKADEDAGRIHPIRFVARSSRPEPPAHQRGAAPVQRVVFPSVSAPTRPR